ncbi:response regulator transcription factor [Pedobacter sp. Leaf176]|uniref:response regulator transcription factor n=1 Tax=Pedobacter sp. Leaf176 TaxID=1736286 RepID=UPI0006F2854B|nr:response regulator transcription factor [Pedobacter sp. Leaf176]KQR65216.1 LuxR family transcriptional regulator [Pedobacter sp. Leaf176]
MKNPIKVLLAEDHTIVRNGIVALLEKEHDIEIIAEAKNGEEVLTLLKSGIDTDVVLTDINMPDMNGMELINTLSDDYPKIKVLVLTMLEQEKYVVKSLQAGASGYLLKNVNIDEIIFAIKQITSGYKYICTGISLKLLTQVNDRYAAGSPQNKLNGDISKREIEILTLIAQGFTNGEIAEKLFTSKRTIEGNRQNLLEKTGTKNTAALISFVIRNRIID